MTTSLDIRKTITMLEKTGMEYVANRDFIKVLQTIKDGITYTLGNVEHDDGDVKKNSYIIYKKVRDGGFEYNDKFFPQEFYVEVEPLRVSGYAKMPEVQQAFSKWVEEN